MLCIDLTNEWQGVGLISLVGVGFPMIKPVSHKIPLLVAHFCQVCQRHAPHHYNCLVDTFRVLNQFVFVIQLNPQWGTGETTKIR